MEDTGREAWEGGGAGRKVRREVGAGARTLLVGRAGSVKLDLRANDERGDLAREFDALMSELRVRRTEMAAVTDASPLGLFRCDADGRMIYVNDA